MNEELKKMLDSIKAKKQEVKDLCKAGKIEDAAKAKDELKELQAQFDLLYDLEQDKLDEMQQQAENGKAKKIVDQTRKIAGAFVNAIKAAVGKGDLSAEDKEILNSMNEGMAYLPEDRKNEGIIADLSVRENLIMALQAKRGMFHLLSRKQQEEFTDKYIEMLQIKTASRETPIKSLSGGNQQKVIIGRWLLTNPDFLILDEPTRGIDVGTKTEIQKLVVKLAKEGMAVVFISSEVEEMLRTCDRMMVMRDGAKVGELSGAEMNQSTIMSTIAGGQ